MVKDNGSTIQIEPLNTDDLVDLIANKEVKLYQFEKHIVRLNKRIAALETKTNPQEVRGEKVEVGNGNNRQ